MLLGFGMNSKMYSDSTFKHLSANRKPVIVFLVLPYLATIYDHILLFYDLFCVNYCAVILTWVFLEEEIVIS